MPLVYIGVLGEGVKLVVSKTSGNLGNYCLQQSTFTIACHRGNSRAIEYCLWTSGRFWEADSQRIIQIIFPSPVIVMVLRDLNEMIKVGRDRFRVRDVFIIDHLILLVMGYYCEPG
jgi:hypothetical protein